MIATALLATGAFTSPAAASPAGPDPAAICAVAGQYAAAGFLSEARALYKQVADSDQSSCIVTGVVKVRMQEIDATEAAEIGRRLLESGDLDSARVKFQEALDLNKTNTDAAAGLAEVSARRALARSDFSGIRAGQRGMPRRSRGLVKGS
ncbi:hypothetical protein [Kitasatospora sp. KL5]|uniref:hypothetical protein n=1 Tax=Kitasatospora sp. KL5 TaxID=3425125 RepID=UPI003D6EAA29